MTAPAGILGLVEKFERHRESYESATYNETQLRREFLDPMFDALGWDVQNREGVAEAYKDVIHEDAIKVGEFTKAPDYAFRIGGTRKFFVEAKKPAKQLKDDAEAAFQLRRYAWSARLPLSILTDFQEFAVYDTRLKPSPKDKASVGRVLYFTHAEYAEKWEEIAGIFSRDAVLKGAFDKVAEGKRPRRGSLPVDEAFLKEIEGWREALAKNLAARNPKLEVREINFAVQRIIDRIIFLRIAEDRGIEPYGRLQGLLNGKNVYARLFELFERADDRYNSGLFHFKEERGRAERPDGLTPGLKVDDEVLKDIIEDLYPPKSPYAFSVIPADILGAVYEQFLGKVIRLTTGHHVKVEEKPEVRKAGGVYYTPTYIVEYIVKQTVGKLLEGKTPKQAAELRVLDPACGSGSFLIGAYQHLLDWHRDWYVKDGVEKHGKVLYQGMGGEWRLTTKERTRILLNNIYGVDIDPQAVEVTKLSLLLKVLEGGSPDVLQREFWAAHERVLPDLGNNIKCGNSLIGTDYVMEGQFALLEDEERTRINLFDWKAEFPGIIRSKAAGFDAVIGNPPYDVLEKDRGQASWPHEALAAYVARVPEYAPALGGKLNLFRFFIVRSLTLIRPQGYFGMIVPLAIFADISCANTRRHLIETSEEVHGDCFPQKDNPHRRVFADAKLSTAVVVSRKAKTSRKDAAIHVKTYPGNSFRDEARECTLSLRDTELLDPENNPIPLVDEVTWRLCRRIHTLKNVSRLANVADYHVTRGEINQTIYRKLITSDAHMARLLKGVEIGRYRVRTRLSQGEREWFNEAAFEKSGGSKPIARSRRIATQRITGIDERLRIVATVIEPVTYFADSTNSVSLSDASSYSLEYLLGLLNSALFQWRFKLTSTNNNVATNELLSLPLRRLDPSNVGDVGKHRRIRELVGAMRVLNDKIAKAKTEGEATTLRRQLDSADRDIDQLVYELYGLTDEEIRIVEEATAGAAAKD
jgi:Alw26I/Eco31I/Esp3I family type II restriction m6 adenine DNA methyltransferase